MVVFPNGKINLGLSVIKKREDNFHELQTVFYPVRLFDALELLSSHQDSFNYSGISLPMNASENLCLRAYAMLKSVYPSIPPVNMHLHKVIPVGAGLGGGSSDAAFTLKILNNKFGLGLTENELIKFAAALGSDCPFFIINEPCYAGGRGDVLERVELDLSMYRVMLVNPGIRIDTRMAFSLVTPAPAVADVKEIIKQPVAEWKHSLVNDFEAPVFKRFPAIAEIKKQLYDAGAIYASMSGSGSTVFGLFPTSVAVAPEFPSDYLVRIC